MRMVWLMYHSPTYSVDNYTAEAMLFHEKYRVAPNKRTGWKRLVGQEVEVDAYSNLLAVKGSASWPAQVANLLDVNGAAVVGAPVSAATTARVVTKVVSGPQTPQATQPALSLWVPLTRRSGGNSIGMESHIHKSNPMLVSA